MKLVNGVLEKNPLHLSAKKCKLCDYKTNRALHLDRHMLSVHSEAAFETVEQVYQASTQPKPGLNNDLKPAVLTNLIKNNPRTNARLPQFANLVRLEKMIKDDDCAGMLGDNHDEMILGDIDEIKKTEMTVDSITGSTADHDTGDHWEEIQFVNTAPDHLPAHSSVSPVQLMSRRISSDSGHSQDNVALDIQDQQVSNL